MSSWRGDKTKYFSIPLRNVYNRLMQKYSFELKGFT